MHLELYSYIIIFEGLDGYPKKCHRDNLDPPTLCNISNEDKLLSVQQTVELIIK